MKLRDIQLVFKWIDGGYDNEEIVGYSHLKPDIVLMLRTLRGTEVKLDHLRKKINK